MGEEENMNEVAEISHNGTTKPEIAQIKEEEKDGVKGMEEDRKDVEKVATRKMDVDDQVSEENKEIKEETIEEEKQSKEEEGDTEEDTRSNKEEEDLKEDTRSYDVKEEMKAEEIEENEEKAEEKVDELKEEDERNEDSKQEKGSNGRKKGKTPGIKVKSNEKEVEEEQKTHVASTTNRPVRARKSVERLVESFEMESVKEFHVEKGRGLALRDIPNVAFKLLKRRTDDTLKLLHTILFGRRGKAAQVKNHIYRFSGFDLTEDEEKQKIKMKEKLDKCVKEKLLGFCDVLDIPIAKADTTKINTRKEDIVAKLIDFLVAPQATTTELLSEKEQSGKGTKRKRVGKQSASMSSSTSSKSSAKKSKMTEKVSKEREKNSTPETEGESGEEEEKKEEENDVHELSRNNVPDHTDSEEDKDEPMDEFEQDMIKDKSGSEKTSAKKESSGKAKSKKVDTPKKSRPHIKTTPMKSSSTCSDVDGKNDTSPKITDGKAKTKEIETPKKSSSPTTKTTFKSSSKHSEVNDGSDTSPKTFSRKKKTEVVKEKSSAPKKPAPVEKTGKKAAKGKDQPKGHKLRPSDDELRNAVCDIIKEVDFNTATFTDILMLLAGRYDTDLTPRKSSIKLMIQNELIKIANEEDVEDYD